MCSDRISAVRLCAAALALAALGAHAQPRDDAAEAEPIGEVTQAEPPSAEPPRSCAPVPDSRPSIGLVLSGGGARGGAHVGVLRALEELRVPVDCIAGTSIGAVVGGFYASGLSVDEIEEIASSIDWDAAFLNFTPREYRSFRRKRDDDLFLVNQRPGLNDGEFELPIGLVQGQVIDMILSRVTAGVGVDDFDELALPFRAVAADIVTGEPVVLAQGDLPRAVRASMSLPAALTPIEIGGQLLVDGGIAMNLPVEVAQQMGADVIIAVDISSALLSRESMRSVLSVTTQLTNLLTRTGVEQQRALLGEDDLLLVPEFDEELTSAAFTRLTEAFRSGYDAVMAEREALERYSLDPQSYAAYVESRADPRPDPLPTVEFVALDNRSALADSIIDARLREIEIGEPLDVEAVEKAIGRVYGLEFFQNVRYDVVRDEAGRTGLEIEIEERSWGPNYLQLGVDYSSSADADATFGLAASYLRTLINERGGEWRATFVVGDEPALLADLYQPLGADGMWFFEPQLQFRSTLFNIFDDDTLAAEIDIREAAIELAAGREFYGWAEVRGGLRGATGRYDLRVGDATLLPEESFRRGELFARFSVDTLDSVAFPTEGVLATIEWVGSRESVLSADGDFDQLLIDTSYAKTWGRHTLLSTFRYDATISGEAPVSSRVRLGGLFDLSGLNRNQLSGQHAVRIGTSYYRRIGDLALFPAFAGISLELGNVWDDRSAIDLGDTLFGVSLWAGVNTPVGPVYVGVGRSDGGQSAAYVSLGRSF